MSFASPKVKNDGGWTGEIFSFLNGERYFVKFSDFL